MGVIPPGALGREPDLRNQTLKVLPSESIDTYLIFSSQFNKTNLMGTQTTAKTIFILVSMVGWLLVGAALMYLCPAILDLILASDKTHLWMQNLSRGGYSPTPALIGGSVVLVITIAGNLIWYRRFEGKI